MARAGASDEAGGVKELREGMPAAATGRERLPVLLKFARIALKVCSRAPFDLWEWEFTTLPGL